MKEFSLRKVSEILFCLFLFLLILAQLHLLEFVLELIIKAKFLVLSILIVFVYEPFIQGIPFKKRGIRCTLVYLCILVLFLVFFVLFIPVLWSSLEKVGVILQQLDFSFLFPVFQKLQEGDWSKSLSVATHSTFEMIQGFTEFMLSYLAAYFISLDLISIQHLLLHHFPQLKKTKAFIQTCNNVVFHYMKGIGVDLLFLFTVDTIILFIFHFSHPILFSAFLAILNLIPYVGATLGQFLIFVLDYASLGQIRLSLWISLFLIQQVESNIVQPFIFSKVLELKPIMTLLSLYFFGGIFGIVGVILAPILAAVIQLAYRSFIFTQTSKKVGTWENLWYNFDEINEEDK